MDVRENASSKKRLIPWMGSYRSMMDRCYRKTAPNYPAYGGRGISVCGEWHDPEVFGIWAEANGFQTGLTIERKDVNGNYCYGYIDKMTDELLPECKVCRSHVSKAQDDLDAWLKQPSKGE